MSTKLRHADSILGKLLRAPANALLLILALGTAAALHAQQSADKSEAGTYSLLYSFQCSPDGAGPSTALIRDSSGDLYGTAGGGQFEYGTVLRWPPAAPKLCCTALPVHHWTALLLGMEAWYWTGQATFMGLLISAASLAGGR